MVGYIGVLVGDGLHGLFNQCSFCKEVVVCCSAMLFVAFHLILFLSVLYLGDPELSHDASELS